jgi:hypothetical protein
MTRFKALIGLILASYLVNQVSPGAGNVIMLGAFVLWFVAGNGLADAQLAWKKLVAFLPW